MPPPHFCANGWSLPLVLRGGGWRSTSRGRRLRTAPGRPTADLSWMAAEDRNRPAVAGRGAGPGGSRPSSRRCSRAGCRCPQPAAEPPSTRSSRLRLSERAGAASPPTPWLGVGAARRPPHRTRRRRPRRHRPPAARHGRRNHGGPSSTNTLPLRVRPRRAAASAGAGGSTSSPGAPSHIGPRPEGRGRRPVDTPAWSMRTTPLTTPPARAAQQLDAQPQGRDATHYPLALAALPGESVARASGWTTAPTRSPPRRPRPSGRASCGSCSALAEAADRRPGILDPARASSSSAGSARDIGRGTRRPSRRTPPAPPAVVEGDTTVTYGRIPAPTASPATSSGTGSDPVSTSPSRCPARATSSWGSSRASRRAAPMFRSAG
ncbi:hypothetical protein SANTM175S_09322 [Streptomyces antimycoticus]